MLFGGRHYKLQRALHASVRACSASAYQPVKHQSDHHKNGHFSDGISNFFAYIIANCLLTNSVFRCSLSNSCTPFMSVSDDW